MIREKIESFLKKSYPKLFTLHSSLFTVMMATAIMTSGCGYKPVAQYGRDLLPDPVYVDVRLSGVEPQNGVYIKDELIRLLKNRFHERVTLHPEGALSRIDVPVYTIGYSPLTYDRNGYVIRYRITVDIAFVLTTPKEKLNKRIRGTEDVSVQPGSLSSTVAKETAIRTAIRKAMDRFVAYVARKGYGK